MHLSRHDDAISCIKANAKLKDALTFEHAYALYRTKKVGEALKVLDGAGGEEAGSFRVLQLKAQLLYRDGQSGESARVYQQLFTVRRRGTPPVNNRRPSPGPSSP